MKVFAATVSACLAVAAAVIHHRDPAGHFRRGAYAFERNWEAGRLLVYPSVIDERALRAAQAKVVEKPDLVLLGSSRAMPVGAAMFRPGLKLFNAGMAGATVQDYAAVWQALLEAGKTPRSVIVYADPWIFNKNAGQFRWRVLGGHHERFRLRTGGGPARKLLARADALWERLRGWNTSFNELLNGPVLIAALRGVRSGRGAGGWPRLVREGEALPAGTLGWRPDGSVYFSRAARSPAETREEARRFAGETEVFSLGRWEPDAEAKELLDALTADAARAGTRLRLIVLPYHPAARARLEERPRYRGLIDGFAAELRRRGHSVCEAQDVAASGCAEGEFEDAMHPLESCHEKILRRCLSDAPWKDLLSRAPAPVLSPAPVRATLPAPPVAAVPPPAAPSAPIEWIRIPGGSFMMGAPDLGAEPVHRVELKTFEMAKTKVTVEQYRACVAAGRCTEPGRGPDCNWERPGRGNHPVNCVDWEQARTFSAWAGGRLASESEWEYAARSGGRDWLYPWGNEEATCERAAMKNGGPGCDADTSWPVCAKPKGNSVHGLCDLAGNSWEWVADSFQDSYEGAPADGRAWEDPRQPSRVFRGGSWLCATANARVDVRSGYIAANRDPRLGFRPVREAR